MRAIIGCFLGVTSMAIAAGAEQKVIQTGTITWSNGSTATFQNGQIGQCLVNWKSPVDYYNGTLRVKLEVSGKANGYTKTNLLMRVLNSYHAMEKCMRFGVGKVLFDANGTHYYTLATKDASPLVPNTTFSWTGPLERVQMVIADSGGQAIAVGAEDASQQNICSTCRNFLGYPNTGLCFPVTIKFTYIAVSAGAVFTPPADWNEPVVSAKPLSVGSGPEHTDAVRNPLFRIDGRSVEEPAARQAGGIMVGPDMTRFPIIPGGGAY